MKGELLDNKTFRPSLDSLDTSDWEWADYAQYNFGVYDHILEDNKDLLEEFTKGEL